MMMNETETLDISFLDRLPPPWPESLLLSIRERLSGSGVKLVILDDDPTGTQTVRDIPVLTSWSDEALVAEFSSSCPAFYILTNSRSLTEEHACRLGEDVGRTLVRAAAKAGVRTVVISRSDSTLRGHFPAEVDAVARAMDSSARPYLIIPFFLEGGRFTVNDIHYVREGKQLVPAACTPFADDAAFGFSHSDLKLWVEEKTGGRIRGGEVRTITLDDIRVGGPVQVARILRETPARGACIVNAAGYRDMEVVVAALLEVEAEGRAFLYRTAASFVRTRIGMEADGRLLDRSALVSDSGCGGLFVIGSYVPKTSRQVERLLVETDVLPLEVQVEALLDPARREREICRVVGSADSALRDGYDVAVYTSRKLITGEDGTASLGIGRIVSDSLIAIVRDIPVQPRFLVAKGGITSSDVATRGLGVKRAMVLGQILPGVPVWKLGGETRYPGMSYIVFPGNVGEDGALVEVKRQLEQDPRGAGL